MTCNEFYKDKAGLPDLTSTKDDFTTISSVVGFLNIDEENRIELIDVGYDKITKEFSTMSEGILAHS